MAALKQIEIELEGTKDLALVANDDSIWLVVPHRWWDLATLVWWLFVPQDKKAKVTLTMKDKNGDATKVSFKAVRVASRHVRIRGFAG